MSNPCGCGDANSIPNLPTEHRGKTSPTPKCKTTVHKNVCVQAEVTITPKVKSGPTKTVCIGKPKFKPCKGISKESCTFTVSQKVCVQIPLKFSASASAAPTGIVCGNEEFGPCLHHKAACTHRLRYFKKHPKLIEKLITSAGNSIVLGIVDPKKGAVGASFLVTTENAKDVLSLDVPSPPAPGSSPFDQKYRKLYAHLLAANLNVLNGATCPFALSAIAGANQFLADSPSGIGMEGARIYSALLERFNNGKAPGCPCHCKKTKEKE